MVKSSSLSPCTSSKRVLYKKAHIPTHLTKFLQWIGFSTENSKEIQQPSYCNGLRQLATIKGPILQTCNILLEYRHIFLKWYFHEWKFRWNLSLPGFNRFFLCILPPFAIFGYLRDRLPLLVCLDSVQLLITQRELIFICSEDSLMHSIVKSKCNVEYASVILAMMRYS